MPRGRVIDKKIFEDEGLACLSWGQRLFFIGLILWGDCKGRGEASPAKLKARLFPYEEVSCEQIADWLIAISKKTSLKIYRVAAKLYYTFGESQWKCWQPQIRFDREAESSIPEYQKSQQVTSTPGLLLDYSWPTPPIREGKGRELKGTRREVERKKNNPPTPQGENEGFLTFWQAYPKKQDKQGALKIWLKMGPDQGLLSQILAAIEKQTQTEQWTKDGGKFIPMPSTWLNGHRWEDEVQEEDDGLSFEARDFKAFLCPVCGVGHIIGTPCPQGWPSEGHIRKADDVGRWQDKYNSTAKLK